MQNHESRRMKIYIAGPDVFRPDAPEWATRVRALCREAGHEALIPLDGGTGTAVGIYENNLRLLGEADLVLANLNPFRGAEPDSGTCVEIGYALALGKPVIGYVDDPRPLRERLQARGSAAEGRCRDSSGWTVEDFGLPLNLMLGVPVQIEHGGLEAALQAVQRRREACT
jgi:nucleoside 2-deoxyribosyltransferase